MWACSFASPVAHSSLPPLPLTSHAAASAIRRCALPPIPLFLTGLLQRLPAAPARSACPMHLPYVRLRKGRCNTLAPPTIPAGCQPSAPLPRPPHTSLCFHSPVTPSHASSHAALSSVRHTFQALAFLCKIHIQHGSRWLDSDAAPYAASPCLRAHSFHEFAHIGTLSSFSNSWK
jgi:hypothetical protein